MTRSRPPKPTPSSSQNPRQILTAAGLSPKKSWSQNFLCDPNLLRLIATTTGADPDIPVVELGAGLGALTHHLLERGGTVLAVERDRELVPLLRDRFPPPCHLEILEKDAARIDYGWLLKKLGQPFVVAGNLPYRISSRIVSSLADARPCLRRAIVLVQLEVGQRMAAPPGGRTYGLLSVLVQRAFAVHLVRRIPPSAFFPRPRVQSVIVQLEPTDSPRDELTDRHLVAAARAAFSARRKMIHNSLTHSLNATPNQIRRALTTAEISEKARAERLDLDDFVRLGQALAGQGLLGE